MSIFKVRVDIVKRTVKGRLSCPCPTAPAVKYRGQLLFRPVEIRLFEVKFKSKEHKSVVSGVFL